MKKARLLTDQVPLFETTSPNSRIVRMLKAGDDIEIHGTINLFWLATRLGWNSEKGYIESTNRFVEFKEFLVDQESVKIHFKPSIDSRIVHEYNMGDRLLIGILPGESQGWAISAGSDFSPAKRGYVPPGTKMKEISLNQPDIEPKFKLISKIQNCFPCNISFNSKPDFFECPNCGFSITTRYRRIAIERIAFLLFVTLLSVLISTITHSVKPLVPGLFILCVYGLGSLFIQTVKFYDYYSLDESLESLQLYDRFLWIKIIHELIICCGLVVMTFIGFALVNLIFKK
jgi:hypothetical protein